MNKYARKVDRNHSQFTRLFCACGYKFKDVHASPGLLDFMVMSKTGRLILMEVKDPDRPAPLTDAERETLAMFAGSAFVVEDEQDALNILDSIDGGM